MFPLGAVIGERFLPIGTAFAVSEIGLVASALHNIRDAARYDHNGAVLNSCDPFPKNHTLSNTGISLVHARLHDTRGQITFWPLESCDAAPPTDLVFGAAVFQPSLPTFPLPLSFAVPRVGAKVTCVGYGGMRFPKDGIPLNEIVANTFNWSEVDFRLKAFEGTVTRVFIQEFASAYNGGSCMALDCEVDPGVSGGPVIDERGYVCGIVSAGATTFFDSSASLASLLYPALATNIRFGADMGSIRFQASHPLITLVGQVRFQVTALKN